MSVSCRSPEWPRECSSIPRMMLSARRPCSLILRAFSTRSAASPVRSSYTAGSSRSRWLSSDCCSSAGQLHAQLGEVVDEVERVLDLVRDAGGQRAERRQLLLDDELLLHRLQPLERVVQAPVRVGVLERDRRVGGEVAQDVQVVVGVRVRPEALGGDDADCTILVHERQVDDRRDGLAGHRRLVLADVALVLPRHVLDDDLLPPLEAHDGEPRIVGQRIAERRQRLAVLPRRREFDPFPGFVAQADPEDRRVHQRVHVLVDGGDDLLDREPCGDVAPDAAEQLHVVVGLLHLLLLLLQRERLLLHA